MGKRNYAVWVGDHGFPVGLATIQRAKLICLGLKERGLNVSVISRYGIHDKSKAIDKIDGDWKGIRYKFASGISYRPKKIHERTLYKIWGFIMEYIYISRLASENRLDVLLLHTNLVGNIVYYKFLCYIYGIPLLLSYVERYTAIRGTKSFLRRLNDILYERIGLRLASGILPISSYLSDLCSNLAPETPSLRVPVITDPCRFRRINRDRISKYFMFVGGAGYSEIVEFCISAFECVTDDSAYLYLVVSGSDHKLKLIQNRIHESPKSSRIKLYSDLQEGELSTLYMNAYALLIPLRPTTQDRARFPHKIGEYSATGNPIISSSFGEVAKFLDDGVNAMLINTYSIDALARKMMFLLDHPKLAEEIGKNGQRIAKEVFDYRKQGRRIASFIQNI